MAGGSEAMLPAARSLSRFRGALLGALLGDCLGSDFEGHYPLPAARVVRFLRSVEEAQREPGFLLYTDDTAMTRGLVRSLLSTPAFDEVDMAKRFAEDYKKDPDRGYGMSVVVVFEKLLSSECSDVFEPARKQFDGKGSYGNGAAMRAVGIPLAYPHVADMKKFTEISAKLTHTCSLGYNGAILQALAVHYALQGQLDRDEYLDKLIGHMKEVEGNEKSLADARELDLLDFPFSCRLQKIREFLQRGQVSKEDVIAELGNGIAALQSVPTAIYSFLRCMELDSDIPAHYNNLQRTIIYCISLGGDTDTIATMAGAIAGAYYGEEQIPVVWKQSCEDFAETEVAAEDLYKLYCKRLESTAAAV
ncbi:ADP-ribosylhydrolase ARH3 [Microcaecilia unicolor]|uniref:ADP-ribosylhydrolase ARH3 n=1 Tax=Microcaecilia unicolor TaxID=1415580 RepID=A0A6P7ZGF9_9AMPH|nr:ADP-ribose glycohydrolase ARH3 [Microcaecilia unicolor]